MNSRTFRKLNLGFLLFGLVLLVALLVRLDVNEVLDRFVQVGWMFGVAFAAYLATLLFSTLAWREIIDPESSTASFGELFASFWAGHALNGLTPAGFGEVLRGTMVARRIDAEEIVASLVVYNYLTAVGVVALIVIGPVLCLWLLDLPGAVVWTLFGLTAAVCVGMVVVRAGLRRGLAEPIARWVAKLPFVDVSDTRAFEEQAATVDRRIRDFRSARPDDFARSMVLVALVRVFQVVELWVLLLALLPDRSPGWVLLVALLARSASQLIAWATAFVPGRIGVLEGGMALLFELLRLDPVVGFSVELLRRLRKVLGIIMGLIVGWIGELAKPGEEAAAQSEKSGETHGETEGGAETDGAGGPGGEAAAETVGP